MIIDGIGIGARAPKHLDGNIQLHGQEQPVHIVYDTFSRDELIAVGVDRYNLQSEGGGTFYGTLKSAGQDKGVKINTDPEIVDRINADPQTIAVALGLENASEVTHRADANAFIFLGNNRTGILSGNLAHLDPQTQLPAVR